MDVSTCIWFDGNIEEAARFYVSLVPGSEVGSISRYPEGSEFPGGTPGEALTLDFTLAGVPYQLLNGGPEFPLTEAVSIALIVDDQDEVDRVWDALIADGGQESQCGWCKDRFGLSWQVVPRRFVELMSGPSAGAVSGALMRMRKIDVAELEAAAAGR
ncbi:VOC family protein [Agrococcus jenensis]|uniref:Putative 3-demethylubiquinone-9 3-methyltransferase (Glyoxalase superfamily) n=1 Tax=Agrococcus jenensis TaxID=46353 RepID=A0A3N2AWK7_9MICO|nr:VOC family protein [Agrococcus jenensis]ROR67393.1 putative 3-demethylubiquinone-9 3-methyltransferase (glyoxalase superfamily) [Agrococcus jenensis]